MDVRKPRKPKKLLTYEEALQLLRSTPGFLDSLTPEQREIAFNAPDEAQLIGKK